MANALFNAVKCRGIAAVVACSADTAPLRADAVVNARDEFGRTALHYAALNLDASGAVALLRAGAAVNVRDREGETPLHWAAEVGSVACCRVLLRAGADVDAACDADWTPLHEAAWGGSADCTALLLAAGADVAMKTHDDGDTPQDLAMDYPTVACMLRDAAARWRGLRRAALTAWCCP